MKTPREERWAIARQATGLGLGLVIVLPVVLFVATSFLTREAVLAGLPYSGDLTLDHYRQLFGRLDVAKLLADSCVLAFLSALLALIIGAMASYFVSRGSGRLPGQIYVLCLSVWFVPPVALSLEVYLWFQRFDLYDQLSGLTLLYTVVHASLVVVLLAPYWDGVPRRLDEVAWVEGWYGFEVVKRIYLPVFWSPFAGLLALTFLRAWNELLFASILTDRRVNTLSVAMQGLTTGSHIEWGQIAALGTIALLPAPVAGLVLWSTVRRISPGALSNDKKETA